MLVGRELLPARLPRLRLDVRRVFDSSSCVVA